MKVDAVFEGGGVRGIAFVGAVCYLEEHGYEWVNLAGTSAGSIIAAFLAAGYSEREIKAELDFLDYQMFLEKSGIQTVPIIGTLLGIFVPYPSQPWELERLNLILLGVKAIACINPG